MIRKFEYKIPYDLQDSYRLVLESGNEIPQWKLISSNEKENVIEWKHKFWSGLGLSKIKVYLKEPRPKSTLATIYIYRPLQIIDPAKMCERVFGKLEEKLNEKTSK